MSNVKTFKKGEFLFKEGDKIQFLQLIQTGQVTLCISRPKKNIDLFNLGASQIVGEQAGFTNGTYNYSAIATTETKVVELPVDTYKAQVDGTSQIIKVVIKSLTERLKTAMQEVRSYKMEKDASPCPEDQVAKIFGTIYHTANHKGEREADKNSGKILAPNKVRLDWTVMKQYAQRIFCESPKRLEQACCMLVKLKMATFEMGKPIDDPDGADEIQGIVIPDITAIEAFFEFYQYYYFKGGRTDLLKSDEQATNLLNQFVSCADGVEPDRFGVVSLDFPKVLEKFKTDYGINLNNDHFSRLEAKGVFCKRAPRADGNVVLQFELKEFKTTQKIWKILKEIEKWNEKGFVDMTEDETKAKKKTDGPACPQCAASVIPQAKFCSECGFKIAA